MKAWASLATGRSRADFGRSYRMGRFGRSYCLKRPGTSSAFSSPTGTVACPSFMATTTPVTCPAARNCEERGTLRCSEEPCRRRV
jgi:hypothetical protein